MASTQEPTTEREISPWAAGLAGFAAAIMIILGFFHALMGLIAIIDDEFYVQLQNYTFELDRTGWGWIHLLVGIAIVVAGSALLAGQLWGRAVGIALAAVSAVANFLWLPYYPVGSVISIALAVAVIWALSRFDVEPTQ